MQGVLAFLFLLIGFMALPLGITAQGLCILRFIFVFFVVLVVVKVLQLHRYALSKNELCIFTRFLSLLFPHVHLRLERCLLVLVHVVIIVLHHDGSQHVLAQLVWVKDADLLVVLVLAEVELQPAHVRSLQAALDLVTVADVQDLLEVIDFLEDVGDLVVVSESRLFDSGV